MAEGEDGKIDVQPYEGLGLESPENVDDAIVSVMADIAKSAVVTWDPETSPDWDLEPPCPACVLRIKRDIMTIYNEPPPGMFIVPDMNNITMIHALITGPFNTPYEGGFFYFLMRCPPDYPMHPPRVKLLTTGDCREVHPGDSQRYNDVIQHETLRVAVCDMLESHNHAAHVCPQALRDVMEKSFPEFYDYYKSTCKAKLHLSQQPMLDPFGENRGCYKYNEILERLQAIRSKVVDKQISAEQLSEEDSDSL